MCRVVFFSGLHNTPGAIQKQKHAILDDENKDGQLKHALLDDEKKDGQLFDVILNEIRLQKTEETIVQIVVRTKCASSMMAEKVVRAPTALSWTTRISAGPRLKLCLRPRLAPRRLGTDISEVEISMCLPAPEPLFKWNSELGRADFPPTLESGKTPVPTRRENPRATPHPICLVV